MVKNKKNGNRQSSNVSTNYRYARPTKNVKGSVSTLPTKVHQNASALGDPFSPNARGSKIPDSNSARSVPMSLRSRHTIGVDGSGNAGSYITPGLADHSCGPSAISSNSMDIAAKVTASDISDFAAINGGAEQYRIVSWGVRVYPLANPTEQKGEITVVTLPDESDKYYGANIAFSGSLFEEIQRYPLAGADVHWISKPKGTGWQTYTAVADSFPAYDNVLIAVSGATPTTVLVVESFFNIEAQPSLLSISNLVSTPAADHHPTALAAGVNVHNKHRGSHNQSTQSLSSKLFGFLGNALADVASAAIPYVGNAVGSVARMGIQRLTGGRQRLLHNTAQYPMIVD